MLSQSQLAGGRVDGELPGLTKPSSPFPVASQPIAHHFLEARPLPKPSKRRRELKPQFQMQLVRTLRRKRSRPTRGRRRGQAFSLPCSFSLCLRAKAFDGHCGYPNEARASVRASAARSLPKVRAKDENGRQGRALKLPLHEIAPCVARTARTPRAIHSDVPSLLISRRALSKGHPAKARF